MKGARAVVLLALLALAAPLAAAGDPAPVFWSPYNAGVGVQAVALAAEGTTLAAGLAKYNPAPGGIQPSVPNVVTTDLSILDLGAGFALNGTDLDNKPEGRPFVAVSRDGSTIVSLGNDTNPNAGATTPGVPDDPTNPSAPSAPSASDTRLRLFFQRALPGANFSAGRATNLTAWLDGAPAGLAVSDDGVRVIVATNNGTAGLTLRGFRFTGSALAQTFEYRTPGAVVGIAAVGNAGRFYAATNLPDGNLTRGALLLFPADAPTPSAVWVDRSADNTTMRGVAASRDGALVAAGTGDGRLLRFAPMGNSLPDPETVALGGATDAVAPVVVSEDGARVSASAGRVLVHLDGATGETRWRVNLSNPATSLALNRTGGVLLATVPSEGLLAFGDLGPEQLWRSAGDARSVSMQASGEVFAFARNQLVIAMRMTHNLSLEHASGGDMGPIKAVMPGKSVSWDLHVRNHGSAPERVRVETAGALALRAEVQPAEVNVRPGETKKVTLTAHADALFTGGRIFNATAVSLTSGARDETTLALAQETAANVTLLVDQREFTAHPGETTTLLLGIQNKGNKDAAVGVRARQNVSMGGPWDVAVDPPSLTLAPSSLTTVRVDVTPPADVPNGTALALTLDLEGQDASDSVTVTLRINPNVGLEVRASPHIRFVQPGTAVHYNVTVKNTGSLPREFEAWYDVLPAEGATPRAWAVDMSTGDFRLDAGATRTIPVRILAPIDVTPADRVAIRVSARMIPLNETETPLLGNVTLFANGEAPVPTPGDGSGGSPIPGPGVPLAVLAALCAGLFLRRRRA